MTFFRSIYRKARKVQETNEVDVHDETDLQELISKSAKGDYKAFGKLYAIYLDRIYGYVYYHVKDKMASEDLTQQVFMKVWEAIGKYEQRDKRFSSWLFRIAHNHIIDYYRNNQREEKAKALIPVEVDDPEQDVEEKLRREEIMKAISILTGFQKEVIVLKFIEGLDNHQIAEVTGKSEGTIRVTQMRALSALRKKLTESKDI